MVPKCYSKWACAQEGCQCFLHAWKNNANGHVMHTEMQETFHLIWSFKEKLKEFYNFFKTLQYKILSRCAQYAGRHTDHWQFYQMLCQDTNLPKKEKLKLILINFDNITIISIPGLVILLVFTTEYISKTEFTSVL
jgi:hypothetical protein